MCGISGIIGENDWRTAEAVVSRMTAAMVRRGPDGQGMEQWPGAVLGHNRLAIFDLSSAGRQPMLSAKGQLGVVFNGAIYNFVELRRELESCGYAFVSQTDTEVLLHGYLEWGFAELVQRLRGMFAIGLWDNRLRKLYLVRDRLGVKPLYYVHHNGQLAFASTARALRASGIAFELDDQAIAEFLEFGFITDERCIYKQMMKVPAAHIVEWQEGKITVREYWTAPAAGSAQINKFADAVAETERLFLRAVERRLQADVPIGTLLSGGVDSSLVCWAVAKLGGDIKAFTIGTPGDPWDETADARATADTLKIEHQVIALTSEEEPGVTDITNAYGEPFASASALGMLRVSQAVRNSATVLLTGDGGDDVFLGYPEHLNFLRASKLARMLPASAANLWTTTRRFLPDTRPLNRIKSFLDYTAGGLGAAICVRDGIPEYRQHGLLGERMENLRLRQREMPWSRASAQHLLRDFLAYDRQVRFVGEYMTKVDGASMYHALEARAPFLDQELWEFAASLPYELRLKGGQLKAVLRALARRHLGDRVASGRKRGFGIPVQRWITGKWQRQVRETFRHSELARAGWIHAAATLAFLDQAVARGSAPRQLWYLFVLELWLRQEREHDLTIKPAPVKGAAYIW